MKKQVALTAGGIAALVGSAGLMTVVSAEPTHERAVVSPAPPPTVNMSFASLNDATNFPLAPSRQLASLEAGESFTIGNWGGVVGVAVAVNGVAQSVDSTDDGFVVTIDRVDGEGVATVELTQEFEDGTSVSLPITTYIGPLVARPELSDVPIALAADTLLAWGDAVGEVGLRPGNEGETTVPRAIGVLDGTVVVLDVVNHRLVNGSPDGAGAVIGDLDGETYHALAANDDNSRMVAIDAMSGTAVDVTSGERFDLPGVVGRLPIDTRYQIGDDSTLLVRSPIDDVEYTIGALGASGLDRGEHATRELDEARAWKVGPQTIAVQSNLSAEPALLEFDTESVTVLETATADDGTAVALVSLVSGDTVATQLVAFTDGHYRSVAVPFESANLMTSHLALDGSAVTVATATADGLRLLTYQL